MSPEVKLFQREIPASSGRPWVIGSSFITARVWGALQRVGAGRLSLGPSPGGVLPEGGGEGGNSRLGRVSVPPQEVRILREAAEGPPSRVPSASRAPLGPWKNWFPPANLFP